MQSTSVDSARRNLLRGRIGAMAELPVRPPWAAPAFAERCTRCADCSLVCEERIIAPGDGGFPTVDFSLGECTFCGACADACKPKALDRQLPRPWRIKAEVTAKCLSQKGISCRSCGDVCDPRAISFQLQTGGRAMVNLEKGYCTGCGACVSVCPVNAIQMKQPAVAGVKKQLEGAA